MNRVLPATALLLAFLAPSGFAAQNQLDANQALFTVMAAINAAGYDAEIDSPSNSPMRAIVRKAVAESNASSIQQLKEFYAKHRQQSASEDLSQYVSFALSIDGPPGFKFRIPETEMPPDVLPLRGLEQILPEFYKEANIEALWNRAQPEFDRVIESYHLPISNALLQANGYLRNPTSGYLGRQFFIYIDLLGPPNQVQSRSYKDDYFVVITPSQEVRANDVRHAYLHYLLDPLSLKYSEQLSEKKSLSDYALGAPALDQAYKDDFTLLATESLIKAVESRLAPRAERQHIVDQAVKEGYVLTAGFADGLPMYEGQIEAMRLYFPQLVGDINLRREVKRLDGIEFAKYKSSHPVVGGARPAPVQSASEKMLEHAQDLSARHDSSPADLGRAKELFLRVLEDNGNSSLHAKAYYGLARIAALERNPGLAQKLFEKTLELRPDTETRSWAYLYLGRLADAAGEHAQAEKHYHAVLDLKDAAPSARSAAEQGLQQHPATP